MVGNAASIGNEGCTAITRARDILTVNGASKFIPYGYLERFLTMTFGCDTNELLIFTSVAVKYEIEMIIIM